MSILLISRSVDKLTEQQKELIDKYGSSKSIDVKYLAFDFTITGPARESFYKSLDQVCHEIDTKGGIGLLVNNVGTANEYPKALEEFTDKVHNAIRQYKLLE